MIVGVAALLALLSPVLTGGRLSRLAEVRFRAAWLVPLALGAQIVVISVVPGVNPTVNAAVHVGTYGVAVVFLVLNVQVPGLRVIAAGAFTNGLAIAVNGGTLPASPRALAVAGIHLDPAEFSNSAPIDGAHLAFLGDVFAVPAGLPFANVFSIGDVLVVAGVVWGAHRTCGSWLVPARRRDHAAGASGPVRTRVTGR